MRQLHSLAERQVSVRAAQGFKLSNEWSWATLQRMLDDVRQTEKLLNSPPSFEG